MLSSNKEKDSVKIEGKVVESIVRKVNKSGNSPSITNPPRWWEKGGYVKITKIVDSNWKYYFIYERCEKPPKKDKKKEEK